MFKCKRNVKSCLKKSLCSFWNSLLWNHSRRLHNYILSKKCIPNNCKHTNRRSFEIQGTALAEGYIIIFWARNASQTIVSTLIDDLWKSRGLHSVSAYKHGLSIQVHACGCSAEQSCFCWGYTEHVGKMTDTCKRRQKRHQKCRSSAHCLWGTCRSDSRFPQLVV